MDSANTKAVLPWTVTKTGTIRYSMHACREFAGLPPTDEPDRLLSTSQAAHFLGYHTVTLIKWRRCHQVGANGRAA